MASPSVVATVAGRLARHPPFDALDPARLERVATATRIRYLEEGEVLFEEGAAPRDEFYVLQKGLIELTRREGHDLQARLDDGDVFGVRAHLASDVYASTARAAEDSLVYCIDRAMLDELLEREPGVARFFAAGFAADRGPGASRDLAEAQRVQRSRSRRPPPHDEVTRVAVTRDVLSCGPDETVQEAARRMSERNVSSILVLDPARWPVGILTDTDLRSRVVAPGLDAAGTPVRAVMTAPVLTVGPDEPAPSLVSLMMRRKLRHFVVTQNGTAQEPVIGVISEHDVLKTHGGHPTFLLNEMVHAGTVARLRQLRDEVDGLLETYLEAQIAMPFVADIVTEINDVLIRRGIAMSLAALEDEGRRAPCAFCWLSLGSEGREEQLLRTDLDNAILFDDVPPERLDEARAFFVELGRRVVDVLVAAGFERCPGDIMASNPRWTLSLEEWRSQFARWMGRPEARALMHANIFFDFRPVDGAQSLAQSLQDFVVERAREERGFLAFFAKSATENPPPLGFFRSFIVERSGENRDTFDVKARAMMPLADAARVLAYDLGVRMYGSTFRRWRRIGEAEPALARLAESAAQAYEILMRLRAREGLARGTSGRFLHIDALTKLERQTLRNTFDVVADVQRLLRSRYQLDYLR